jgi:hypothetical protein
VNNNRCSFCGNEEVYLHYFITCSFLKTFWGKIYNLFKSNNLEKAVNYIAFCLINMKSQYNSFFPYNLISFNVYSTFGRIFCFNNMYPVFWNRFSYNVTNFI